MTSKKRFEKYSIKPFSSFSLHLEDSWKVAGTLSTLEGTWIFAQEVVRQISKNLQNDRKYKAVFELPTGLYSTAQQPLDFLGRCRMV
jgi:hypothetical protein